MSAAQRVVIEKARQECYARMNTDPPRFSEGIWCNRTWDDIMCWNDTPALTTVKQRCASYIYGFAQNKFAHKTCTSSGDWYRDAVTNRTWTNYSACMDKSPIDNDTFQDHMNRISTINNFGYGASFFSLSAAIIILIFCRRFNYKSSIIHINLFLSFCVRSLFCLLRQNLFTHGFAMDIDMDIKREGLPEFKPGIHWECRLLFTLFVYGVAVSQSWIFVEGVYLQMLFYRTLHTQQRGIKIYVIFGWCFPLTFIIPWVIVRLMYDNVECWSNPGKIEYVWIIRAPQILLILINFFFFINTICVLFKRTQARMVNHTARKLAKFIVMLVPLFGVPNVIFMLFPPDRLSAVIDLTYMYISMLYGSFQGVILSFLYCFLHKEVRLTIKQSCHRFFMRRRINLNLRSHDNRSLMSRVSNAPNGPVSTNVSEMNGSSYQVVEMPTVQPNNHSGQRPAATTSSVQTMFRLSSKKSNPVVEDVLCISKLPQTDLDQCRVSGQDPSGQKPVTSVGAEKGSRNAKK